MDVKPTASVIDSNILDIHTVCKTVQESVFDALGASLFEVGGREGEFLEK